MKNNHENIFVISNSKNEKIALTLALYITRKYKYNVSHNICKDNFIFRMINIYKDNVYKKNDARLIVIDDYGIMPFMVLGKIKGSVVAVLEDELSAKLTKQHNNPNVIVLPSLILGTYLLYSIIDSFFLAEFEKDRHVKRIEMLDILLEKEII